MIQGTDAPAMTVEDYIQHDLHAERPHEYINGKLFEMPGEKKINNEMAFLIAMLLFKGLPKDYKVYSHDVKVSIPGGQKYYYPDVFATSEPYTTDNQYISYAPALIVEVVSESSHTHDYVDKYLDYIQIPSLQYYIVAEPETTLVTAYERCGEHWVAHKYMRLDDVIILPLLGLQLPMAEIYR